MADVAPYAVYRGFATFISGEVISCTYTCSHGISPGTVLLKCQPLPSYPAVGGNVVLGGGPGPDVTVRGCHLDNLRFEANTQDGFTWTLELSDRRWRWRDFGRLDGLYNQLDPLGKLLPWTVRSPTELIVLCLAAMGEARYTLSGVPPGLSSAEAAVIGTGIPRGFGIIPPVGTNPPVDWRAEVPAQALARVCEMFGLVVVYRPQTDDVLVTIPGTGPGVLPAGHVASQGPELQPAQRPGGVQVVGSPTKYQGRFLLEPVGEEWDGSYRPIDLLSYAPVVEKSNQEVKFVVSGDPSLGEVYFITLDGVEFSYAAVDADTPNDVAGELADAIRASTRPEVTRLSISRFSGEITVTAKDYEPFDYACNRYDPDEDGTGAIKAVLVQIASKGGPSWYANPPPYFPDVRATDRLTYFQALELAQRSVWRYFRLIDRDVSTGEYPIAVPGYGTLARREQVLLMDTKVEQVVPQPPDADLIDRQKDPQGLQGYTAHYYNGYSRDQPAWVFSKKGISIYQMDVLYRPADPALAGPVLPTDNTPKNARIFVPLSVDPTWQLAIFSAHVFHLRGGHFYDPELVIETGCQVHDAATNQLAAYSTTAVFTGPGTGGPLATRLYPDVQLNVYGVYDEDHKLTGTKLLEADAVMRADYYLKGMVAQYPEVTGQTVEYNGIQGDVHLDGQVRQVTWEVEVGVGSRTVASKNSEHSLYVPPAPARRRAERLRPAEFERYQPPRRIDPSEPREMSG